MINRNLILFIFVFCLSILHAENRKSPHGTKLTIDCTTCHKTEDWNKIKENGYNHNKTGFPLTGQHKMVSCRKCHPTLKFDEAKSSCISCHKDVHEGTVDRDCKQCHNTSSWLVNNIRQIHQNQGFPLLGEHAVIDCNKCHTSASSLRFDNIQSDCYSCHRREYDQTKTPNHKEAGFGIDCTQCHKMSSQSWIGAGFDHNFFPLKGGHNIECLSCHPDGYKNASPDCISCHKWDYDHTKNPVHSTSNFSKDCKSCHSINSWTTTNFDHDKLYFPINSGKHKGQWTNCNECHPNSANQAEFSCTNCHEHNKTDMDSKHKGKSGYVYNSVNCYSCHPRGRK